MADSRRAVVVGASAAGVSAAIAMRDNGFDGTITIIDADPHEPYERPPLSKLLLSGEDLALTPIVPETFYKSREIELWLGIGVRQLDRDQRRVVLGGGSGIQADRVILATGATPRRLRVPGAELGNVMELRDAGDAAVLSERLAEGGPLVLIGGGYIGLELAAMARTMGIDVTVADVAPLPLVGSLGPELARLMLDLHTERGVKFVLDASVASFLGQSKVEAVELADGTRLPAATVIVGVGVTPNVALARELGLGSEAGIPVDVHGSTGDPWIWAAGDVAIQENPHLEYPARIEHWDTARRHGEAVGAAAAGQPMKNDILPYVWSEQYGMMLQSFGRARTGDTAVLREDASTAGFAAYWLRDGRLAAVTTLALPRVAAMGKRLIEARAKVSAEALRDPATDLRGVLKSLSAR